MFTKPELESKSFQQNAGCSSLLGPIRANMRGVVTGAAALEEEEVVILLLLLLPPPSSALVTTSRADSEICTFFCDFTLLLLLLSLLDFQLAEGATVGAALAICRVANKTELTLASMAPKG